MRRLARRLDVRALPGARNGSVCEAQTARENRHGRKRGLKWQPSCHEMTPERWKRVDELFHAARSRPSGERTAFLVEICRDDLSLRRDVESLLQEDVSADGFLHTGVSAPIDDAAEIRAPVMSGRTLGGYHL